MTGDSELRNYGLERGVVSDRTTASISVERFTGTETESAIDVLAVEEPLECQLAYGPINDRQLKSISVTMRTPGHDFELAAGFLMTEGVINDPTDVMQISYMAGRPTAEALSDEPLPEGTAVLPYMPERNI